MGKDIKVLIVEDEKAIAFDLKFIIESLNFTVCGIAGNYEDAIRQAISSEPDLALVDIHLKGKKSGIEAAKTFRENFDLPVIFLTSSTDADTLNQAIETEPFAYLVKPVRKEDLFMNIGLAMANHEKSRKLRSQLENISSAMDTLDTPLFIIGADKKINYINKCAEQLSGYSNLDLKGKNTDELLKLPGGNSLDAIFKEETSALMSFPEHTLLKSKNHGDLKIKGNISTFTDQEGNSSGYLLTLEKQNITNPKNALQQDKDATFLSDEYFFIKDKGQMYRVNLSDINYIEALGDYIIVHTDNKRFTTLMTMKKLEQTLPSDKFARVHRSFIIAVDKIKIINSNDMDVYIKEKRIPIGETYKQELLRKIKVL